MSAEYVNGSNLLMKVDGKAIGHCTSHSVTLNTETKARSVKAPFEDDAEAGLWDEKSVNKRSATINGEGLVFLGETENGYKELLTAYKKKKVAVEAYLRGDDDPYLTGNFIITSLENTNPAGDDATYSFTAENTGEVTLDESKIGAGEG